MIWYYVKGLYQRADQHHIFLLAGGLAFSLFVCMVPLLLIVFAGVGIILGIDRYEVLFRQEIQSFIDRAIPYSEYSSHLQDFVIPRVIDFLRRNNWAGIVGVVGLVFASSGLFSSMRTVLNQVYQVRPSGPIFMGKLRDLALIVMVLVYFLLSTMILPAWSVVTGFADHVEFLQWLDFTGIQNAATKLFSFILILGAYSLVYLAVPERKQPRKVVLTSALSAAILWEAAKQLFGLYITELATFQRIYGAYALTVVVAFWIYYTSLVFIIGAEIGRLRYERRPKADIPQALKGL